VGFRFTTEHIARNYDVGGYVRNLPDGSVEVVAEGKKSEIEDFLSAVEARMKRYVRRKNIQWLEHKGVFADFGIRF